MTTALSSTCCLMARTRVSWAWDGLVSMDVVTTWRSVGACHRPGWRTPRGRMEALSTMGRTSTTVLTLSATLDRAIASMTSRTDPGRSRRLLRKVLWPQPPTTVRHLLSHARRSASARCRHSNLPMLLLSQSTRPNRIQPARSDHQLSMVTRVAFSHLALHSSLPRSMG